MNSKEKAKKLVEKFRDFAHCPFPLVEGETWADINAETHNAKRCALIAVDETIRTLNEDIRDIDVSGNILLDLIDYWRKVKTEIEKL